MKKLVCIVLMHSAFASLYTQELPKSNQFIENNSNQNQALIINDTIWVIDSLLWQNNINDVFVNMQKNITKSRDAHGRKLSGVWLNWNIESENWINNSLDSVVLFNSNGQVKEQFKFDWSQHKNEWVNTFYRENAASGNILEETSLNWDDLSQMFMYGHQRLNEYNDLDLPTSSTWDELEKTTQAFEKDKRWTHFYNDINQNTLTIWEKWDSTIGVWNQYSKKEQEYNVQGFVEGAYYYQWNADSSNWQNDYKIITAYNSKGLVDTISIFNWLTDHAMWFPSDRYIYDYNADGRRIESIKQDGYLPGEWLNESRGLITYEQDKIVEQRTQNWVSNDWQDDRIEINKFIHDSILESNTHIYYDEYNDVYDTTFRWFYIFNNNYLITKVLQQAYSESEFYTVSQIINYWNPFIVSNTEEDPYSEIENTIIIYPNPATSQVNIQSEETIEEIKIVNYLGQIVLVSESNEKQLQINTSKFEAGIYIVRIKTDKEVLNKRLVITN